MCPLFPLKFGKNLEGRFTTEILIFKRLFSFCQKRYIGKCKVSFKIARRVRSPSEIVPPNRMFHLYRPVYPQHGLYESQIFARQKFCKFEKLR